MNAETLEEKMLMLYPTVLSFVRKLANLHDAEDIAQDTMIKALRFKEYYDSGKSLKNWLYGIAHNQFLDCIKKTKRRNEFSFDPGDENLQNFLRYEDESSSLEEQPRDYGFLIKVIEELSPIRRDTLIQKYFLNRSYKDIAKECNITMGTVKSRLHCARRDLELKLAV